MVTPRDVGEVTDFRVFERLDGALVLVPSLFQLPQSLEDEGMLGPATPGIEFRGRGYRHRRVSQNRHARSQEGLRRLDQCNR